MDPKVKYSHCESLIGHARILLPALDRIVPAAAIVAKKQSLSTNQQEQLADDFELMRSAKQRLDRLFSKVARGDSPEAFFVRSAIGGGIINLIGTFIAFDQWAGGRRVL